MRHFGPSAATSVVLSAALLAIPTLAFAQGGDTTSSAESSAPGPLAWAYSSSSLRDLQPSTSGPFDGAKATAALVGYRSSLVVLSVRGIDSGAAGQSFGAHLHVGPCRAGDGAVAGAHYNADVAAGIVPPAVNTDTEVWLDFTVAGSGRGQSSAVVPFVPTAGERSIVIHAEPTAPNGTAGARLACLPLTIH